MSPSEAIHRHCGDCRRRFRLNVVNLEELWRYADHKSSRLRDCASVPNQHDA
jgi:hypothetical protein